MCIYLYIQTIMSTRRLRSVVIEYRYDIVYISKYDIICTSEYDMHVYIFMYTDEYVYATAHEYGAG